MVSKMESSNFEKKSLGMKVALFVLIILFVFLTIGISIFAIFGGFAKKEIDTKKENVYELKNYDLYVDIIPALKLNIEEKYIKCSTGKCLIEILVKDFEVIEYDMNGVFDFYKIGNNSELNNVLFEMLKKAESYDVDVENVDFYSNSDKVGNYLNINGNITYGFYLADISGVDDFYGRLEEDVPKEEVVIKQFKVNSPSIIIKNTNDNYKYELEESDSIVVIAKGNINEIDLLYNYVEFFIDAQDLAIGKNEVSLNVISDLDIEFEVLPDKIGVTVIDKSALNSKAKEE